MKPINTRFRYTRCAPLIFAIMEVQQALGCARFKIWRWYKSGELGKAYPGMGQFIEEAVPARAWTTTGARSDE